MSADNSTCKSQTNGIERGRP